MGRIEVRVVPRALRDEVVGFDAAGRLRVRLTAPPVEGAANRALLRLLARRLGVARGRVGLVGGATSRTKVVEVEGMTGDALRAELGGNQP